MKSLWMPLFALVWKDILLEARAKDILVSVLVFSFLVIVIFNFSLNPTPQAVAFVAPGILWAAFVFGGVLGLTRSFGLEKDQDSLHGLLIAPIGRDTIFFGKMLSIFFLMVLVELIVFPIFAMLFNLPLFEIDLIPVALLATLGIATVGTVFSAMAVNTRSREVMLPLLFLPVVIPLIMAAVEITGWVIRDVGPTNAPSWLPLLVAFDVIFLVICPVAFSVVVEE